MSVDFPRAWEIARAADVAVHHEECSFRVTDGAILCDCDVLTQHPEYKDDLLQTSGGEIWQPKQKASAARAAAEGGDDGEAHRGCS